MSDDPFFSVVLATYNRSRDIRPTIESVLRQSFPDFELLVVGDGCTDDTGEAVRSFDDARVSWRNLPENSGSQSAPNNAGIRAAKGDWVAYIGHDDIWAPDHLACLHATAEETDDASFAVSGCIYYGPPGSKVYLVTGIFSSREAPRSNFFPPSSVAHRQSVVEHIGYWKPPRELRSPVDADFHLRAARDADLLFVSTGQVTVHKFAAGHRYLSYLHTDCHEQQAVLEKLESDDRSWVGEIVAEAKRSGRFMITTYRDFSTLAPGSLFEENRKNKGISRPEIRPLDGQLVIRQSDDPRGLDWHPLEDQIRWSGPSPSPKILLPVTGERARISLEVVRAAPSAKLDDVRISADDENLPTTVTASGDAHWITCEVELEPDRPTVLTLHTPVMFCPAESGEDDHRRLGIAVGGIIVEPLCPQPREVEARCRALNH